jgi:hypothetical protein
MLTKQWWIVAACLFGSAGCALSEEATETVSEVAGSDFALLNGPNTPTTETVKRGSGGLFDVELQSIGGFNGVVAFTADGMPIKTTSHFSSPSLTGSGETTFEFQTIKPQHDPTHGIGTPPGTYAVTLIGTSGTLSHSVGVTVIVR